MTGAPENFYIGTGFDSFRIYKMNEVQIPQPAPFAHGATVTYQQERTTSPVARPIAIVMVKPSKWDGMSPAGRRSSCAGATGQAVFELRSLEGMDAKTGHKILLQLTGYCFKKPGRKNEANSAQLVARAAASSK